MGVFDIFKKTDEVQEIRSELYHKIWMSIQLYSFVCNHMTNYNILI